MSRIIIRRGLLVVLLTISASLFPANAQPPAKEAKQKMNPLPGRSIPLETAIASPLIFLGELLESGSPDPGAPGEARFGKVKVKVSKSLKGDLKGEVFLSMSVRTFPMEKAERLPSKGELCVFFVNSENMSVVRVLAASDEIIDCVSLLVKLHAAGADQKKAPDKE